MIQILSRRRRFGERGFTLIELLIVVAIIAILAAILIPNFLRSRGQSRVAATKGTLRNVGTALESYFVQFGGYPATMAGLVGAGFMNTAPTMPNGVAYEYKVNSATPPSNYRVCDGTTDDKVSDQNSQTLWYYSPGGLTSAVGTPFPGCPNAP